MKNKKGFTLVELLAVIVVLGIILTIATISVMDAIEDSKYKARYIAAEELLEVAKAYMATEPYENCITEHSLGKTVCVKIKCLMDKEYINRDATNPRTGENEWPEIDVGSPSVCYFRESGAHGILSSKTDYRPTKNAECGNTFATIGTDSFAFYFEEGFYRFGEKESAAATCGYRRGNVDKSIDNESGSKYDLPKENDCNIIQSYLDKSLSEEEILLADINVDNNVDDKDVQICNCIVRNKSIVVGVDELTGTPAANTLYKECRNNSDYGISQ